ncbi:hypothetical protein SAV14893_001310 [Streptomyces avermitilis]|uniref:Uncharacterized protein n=1 Tax=Streptomyces avermitilis TaxID=33903 RepID=A0A4D4LQM0_STRAX|nr:hypothetical protein SAV14893_001310 [Streptomyces avermitilis]
MRSVTGVSSPSLASASLESTVPDGSVADTMYRPGSTSYRAGTADIPQGNTTLRWVTPLPSVE